MIYVPSMYCQLFGNCTISGFIQQYRKMIRLISFKMYVSITPDNKHHLLYLVYKRFFAISFHINSKQSQRINQRFKIIGSMSSRNCLLQMGSWDLNIFSSQRSIFQLQIIFVGCVTFLCFIILSKPAAWYCILSATRKRDLIVFLTQDIKHSLNNHPLDAYNLEVPIL